jgi:hypothetical protein
VCVCGGCTPRASVCVWRVHTTAERGSWGGDYHYHYYYVLLLAIATTTTATGGVFVCSCSAAVCSAAATAAAAATTGVVADAAEHYSSSSGVCTAAAAAAVAAGGSSCGSAFTRGVGLGESYATNSSSSSSRRNAVLLLQRTCAQAAATDFSRKAHSCGIGERSALQAAVSMRVRLSVCVLRLQCKNIYLSSTSTNSFVLYVTILKLLTAAVLCSYTHRLL